MTDSEPGIYRQRRGKGFCYLTTRHRPVRTPATLDRIRRLAIPPAYTDVWICRRSRGHLQATGRDARRRKQYRYHAKWRETRDDGEGFTAKDFRTWGATVRAISFLSCQARDAKITKSAFNRCVVATARHVADALHNTPAVCRKSYINPAVFTAWRAGTIDKLIPHTPLSPGRMEKAALQVLKGR